MYVRRIQRRNKDGSVVRYVQLATNYRANGTTKAEVLLNLGREDRLDLEVDVVFFDTTSTYFERDTPDTEGSLRRFGHSKDHRPDLPQIVIGLAVTREGIPVRCWVWPGSTNDQTVIEQVRADVRAWRLGRVVTVVDSGFSSEANLACLTRAGGHYIAGVKMRDGSAKAGEALARHRYQHVRDNPRVKEVRLASDPTRRWIICHNPAEAERDATRRTAQLAAIEDELARIKTAREQDAARARARAAKAGLKRAPKPSDAPHRKAGCALRDHPSLGRWLKQHPATGKLSIDRAKVKTEANLDGKYLLATSDPDLTPEDVALGYKNLLEAERAFRTMKSTLNLRPVYHRVDERIRAHVLLCWLALLLVRVAERRTGTTWRTIRNELGRLHQVTLTGPAGSLRQLTEPTDLQTQIFKDCGIPMPPKTDGLEPSITR
ncbi:IS1634 family transposase [Kitasatospora sp. NBC_01266]|nr:IS1634 family transposase [Kitasatospora sp. NBC_01266]